MNVEQLKSGIVSHWEKILVGLVGLFCLYAAYGLMITYGAGDDGGEIKTMKNDIGEKLDTPAERSPDVRDYVTAAKKPWKQSSQNPGGRPFMFQWIPLLKPVRKSRKAEVGFRMPGPVNLKVNEEGITKIALGWELETIEENDTNKSLSPERLELQRQEPGEDWKAIKTISDPVSTTFNQVDEQVTPRTAYKYRVVAFPDKDADKLKPSHHNLLTPDPKLSNVVEAEAQQKYKLKFVGVQKMGGTNHASIEVTIRNPEAKNEEERKRTVTTEVAPGQQIKENPGRGHGWETPFTLEKIEERPFVFFWEEHEDKLEMPGRTEIREWTLHREEAKRNCVIVKDEHGKTLEPLWIQGNWHQRWNKKTDKAPWRKKEKKYTNPDNIDKVRFTSTVPVGPDGEDIRKLDNVEFIGTGETSDEK